MREDLTALLNLLGSGKPLRAAFESGRLHSMILWGPPGVGKTTLALLVAQAFDAQFIAISAVLGGVKDIRDAVERAQIARNTQRRTVVFVDEVHRFNKAQQDAFLPWVEQGLLTFIGATTDNFLRAFDTANGSELWKARLPAGGQATPMSYEIGGRQYVVIAAGGHAKVGTTRGDFLVAFALPGAEGAR